MPTIMLVDDDEMVLRTMAAMLREGGHKVSAFSDAAAALASSWDGIEALVTDLDMPVMPGEEFIQQVRKGSNIPIIAVSGYIPEERKNILRNIGAQGILAKPISVDAFLETISVLT